jgi:hypothetical protein
LHYHGQLASTKQPSMAPPTSRLCHTACFVKQIW